MVTRILGGGTYSEKGIPLLRQHCDTHTLSCTKPRNPYPYWHTIWAEIHTLNGTKGIKSVPYVAQLDENIVKLKKNIWHSKTLSFLAHNFENHTLSGTEIDKSTLYPS